MRAVTISSKYQIVIPEEIRKSLGLKPGQQVKFFNINGSVRLVPVRPIEYYLGRFKDGPIDMSDIREKKDREL